jgi:hypothetical protein
VKKTYREQEETKGANKRKWDSGDNKKKAPQKTEVLHSFHQKIMIP